MQREIEFRAWDIQEQRMIQSYAHKGTNGRLYIVSQADDAERIELMQFTGLLDKNGKKIFEGDVLKIYFEGNGRSYLKEVKWLNDAINKGRWDALDNCAFTSCEVVGNIFENPELLAEINNN